MSPYSGPNGTWWKIITAMIPLVAGAIFAFARVQSDVVHLEAAISQKADKDVVQANQEAIIRELNGIEAKLDRMSGLNVGRLR